MKASNLITVTNPDGGTTQFNLNGAAQLVQFDVDITDPCDTATIAALTFTTTPLVVVDGSTAFTEWTPPITNVDTGSGGNFQVCGKLMYEVYADTSSTALTSTYNANWAVITEPSDSTYRMTVEPGLDLALIANEGFVEYTLQIKNYLDTYPTRLTWNSIVVRITETTCNCQYL